MRHISVERPPLNLLRQELASTCIYMDILQKSTSELDSSRENNIETNDIRDSNASSTPSNLSTMPILLLMRILVRSSSMNSHVFRKHLRKFYPLLTKLVCCDQ
ncbi:hypothetical protein SOVF_087260 isoform B, partial [Spinacia oleracea]